MTDAERIARLELTVERLLERLKYRDANEHQISPSHSPYELLRQYVRGDLQPQPTGPA